MGATDSGPGTFGPDVLIGDGRWNPLLGRRGADRIVGGRADDVIDGQGGDDTALGRRGSDVWGNAEQRRNCEAA